MIRTTGATSTATTESDTSATSRPTSSTPVTSPTRSTSAITSTPTPSAVLGPVGVDGVNDASCISDLPPVVLLHGTVSTIAVDYPVLVPALRESGRCVYGADYGNGGTGPVRDAAGQAATVIREILQSSGSPTVDVVGFSQGGLVLRTALRLDGVADVVGTAVLISPSFHGTTSPLVSAVPAAVCPACADQAAGSDLLTELAAGGDLDGDVRYAVVMTSADQVVTPWESQLPDGPSDRVRSVVVDQQCPGLTVRHQDMSRTPAVVSWVVAALEARGDVEPAAMDCG